MSADNMVAVVSFPTSDGEKEYRVAHCQAIENCDDDPNFPQELTDAYRVFYFGESGIYLTEHDAFVRAEEIYNEIMSDDFCPVCEYGICSIAYTRPFPTMTKEEASKVSKDYWDNWSKQG